MKIPYKNLDHFRFYPFVQSEKRSELTYDPGGWHIKILPFRTWIRRHFHQYIGMFLDDFLSSEFSMFHLSVVPLNCPMTRVWIMQKSSWKIVEPIIFDVISPLNGPKLILPRTKSDFIPPRTYFTRWKFCLPLNFGVDTDFTSIQKIAPGRLFHLIKIVKPNQILFHLYPELISPRQNDSDGVKISNWILTLVHTLPELGTLHCAAIWVFVTIVVLENKSDSR